MTRGRKEEAKSLLQKAAKINGKDISDETMEMLLAQNETEPASDAKMPSAIDRSKRPVPPTSNVYYLDRQDVSETIPKYHTHTLR